jgi:glycogen debranching enzyme
MPITLDRSVCCNLDETISREWLVTNGVGGYAAGTVAGMLTRMQHGLLVAFPPEETTPHLLLAKIDEEVNFDQRTYYLGTNEYREGTLNPAGFFHLETFQLEEGFPIFTYRLGGINGLVLEKRIWMPQGHNTTYIQYRVLRKETDGGYRRSGTTGTLRNGPARNNGYGRYHEYAEVAPQGLTLTLLPLSAYRPHDQPQYGSLDQHFQVQQHRSEETGIDDPFGQTALLPKGVAGCTIRARDGAAPYHLLAVGHPESKVTFIPTNVWYWKFRRRHDAAAGRPPTDDLYLPGVFRATLWPSDEATLTIIATTEELLTQAFRPTQLHLSYTRSVEEQHLLVSNAQQPQRFFGEGGEAAQAYRLHSLPLSTAADPSSEGAEYLRTLLQAGNRFLMYHTLPRSDSTGKFPSFFGRSETIPVLLSDFYSMEYRTRDALIALPGLLLTTQRYDAALSTLRLIARHFKQGLLPDRIPLSPDQRLSESDYGSVDTTLWYFVAFDAYLRATRHYEFLDELYHRLDECINWYIQGTSNGVRVDPHDGLLSAQQHGKALTWMNAIVNGTPVTPRSGKPVEVNALWYHTLSLMHEWSQSLYRMGSLHHMPSRYQELLTHCRQSFQERFWYAQGNYLFDVIDGPGGDDTSIRPNQLFALSLRPSLLQEDYREHVFEVVTEHLLTPYGLRTLAPQAPGYCGHVGEQQQEQYTLHQGSVWAWLLGPYINATLSLHASTATVPPLQDEKLYREYLWRKGLQLLEPFRKHLSEGLLGMIGGVFDGDAPHYARYSLASVPAIGEILRAYGSLVRMYISQPTHAISI